MIKLALNNTETELLDTIQRLGYGEIYDLEKNSAPPVRVQEITLAERDLIKLLRQQPLSKLIIHDSQPKSAEHPIKINGRRCLQKIRF